MTRINAVSLADVEAVAKKYLIPARSTTLRVKPDPLGKEARAATTQAAMNTPVPPSSVPPAPRVVDFPKDYPEHAPFDDSSPVAHFAKGEETDLDGVKIIVMPDHRLPLVNWSLTTRAGSYADPIGKEDLSQIANEMLRRGSTGLSASELSEDLESHGISLEITDGGDFTRLSGSCITSELNHALQRTRQVLFSPTFPAEELCKVREQTVNQLRLAQESPTTVAGNDLNAALWGVNSVLGRSASPKAVENITLEDVKSAYHRNIDPRGAILMLAGDVTVERGRALAKSLLGDWHAPGHAPPAVTFSIAQIPSARHIILVDRPGGKQATVRMAVPGYDIRNPDKFAVDLAGSNSYRRHRLASRKVCPRGKRPGLRGTRPLPGGPAWRNLLRRHRYRRRIHRRRDRGDVYRIPGDVHGQCDAARTRASQEPRSR